MAPAAPKMEEVMWESAADEAEAPAISAVEADAHQDRAAADALEEAPADILAPETEGEMQAEPQAEAPPAAEMEGGEEVLGIAAESVEEEKAAPGEEIDMADNLAKEVGEQRYGIEQMVIWVPATPGRSCESLGPDSPPRWCRPAHHG